MCTLFLNLSLIGQTDTLKYRIDFTDKDNNGFSIQNPEGFLSDRAIERRIKQGISINRSDLPVTQSYIDSLKEMGFKILHRSKWFNSAVISTNDTQLINNTQQISFVHSSGKVVKRRSQLYNYEKYAPLNLSGLRLINDYGASFNQIQMHNGDLLHDQGLMGHGLVIALADGGFFQADISPVYDRLRSEGRLLGTRDFVEPGNDVYQEHSHGANVLSTMAAFSPGNIVGTAPDASYWLLRTEDVFSELIIEEENWIAAMEFADSAGADIINTSLSYTTFDDSLMNHTYMEMDGKTARITRAANMAASKGMLLINSAGNYGFGPWGFIGFPCDADSILAVGSVDGGGQYLLFSSRGPTFDGRIKPNVSAQGSSVIIPNTNGQGVRTSSGTSFSSPIIAGLAACLWQDNPDKTNMEIFKAIEESSHQHNNPDNLLGFGIPDFMKANKILKDIDNQPGQKLFVYPNPFQSSFSVYFMGDRSEIILLEVFNAIGQKIWEQKVDERPDVEYHINIDRLSLYQNGVYFLRYRSESTKEIMRIIKSSS